LKYEQIDQELSIWTDNLEKLGAIVNDNLIINKAMLIAKAYKINDFKGSVGWLLKFKSRHGLKLRRLHGESYVANPINVTEFLDFLSSKINEYKPENVYNADETGIFYKIIPSKTVCKNIRKGSKIIKDRISVLLCVNMTGSVRRKPYVIGKFAKPRCFKHFSPKKLVDYNSSSRAWMTADIFNKWLLDWDMELEKLNLKVLLIIDNCSSHRIDINLKCIEILFLPPNLTSMLQPLDQGIIKCFKNFFTSKKLCDIIERIESGEDAFDSYNRLTVKDAIIYIKFAWEEITKETIVNCFKHAKWYSEAENSLPKIDSHIDVYKEFIEKAQILDPLEERVFNDFDYDENDVLLDAGLENHNTANEIEDICNDELMKEDKDFETLTKVVKIKECYKAFQIIKDYYNQPGMFDSNAAIGINEISKALKRNRFEGTLDSWIIKK